MASGFELETDFNLGFDNFASQIKTGFVSAQAPSVREGGELDMKPATLKHAIHNVPQRSTYKRGPGDTHFDSDSPYWYQPESA